MRLAEESLAPENDCVVGFQSHGNCCYPNQKRASDFAFQVCFADTFNCSQLCG